MLTFSFIFFWNDFQIWNKIRFSWTKLKNQNKKTPRIRLYDFRSHWKCSLPFSPSLAAFAISFLFGFVSFQIYFYVYLVKGSATGRFPISPIVIWMFIFVLDWDQFEWMNLLRGKMSLAVCVFAYASCNIMPNFYFVLLEHLMFFFVSSSTASPSKIHMCQQFEHWFYYYFYFSFAFDSLITLGV